MASGFDVVSGLREAASGARPFFGLFLRVLVPCVLLTGLLFVRWPADDSSIVNALARIVVTIALVSVPTFCVVAMFYLARSGAAATIAVVRRRSRVMAIGNDGPESVKQGHLAIGAEPEGEGRLSVSDVGGLSIGKEEER
jgi:hypothetical protein